MSNKQELETLIKGLEEIQAEHDRLSQAKTAFALSIGLYPVALVANTGRSINRAAQKFSALLRSYGLERSERQIMRDLKAADEDGISTLIPIDNGNSKPTPVIITMLELW